MTEVWAGCENGRVRASVQGDPGLTQSQGGRERVLAEGLTCHTWCGRGDPQLPSQGLTMLYLAAFFAPEIQSHPIVWRLYAPPCLQECTHLFTMFFWLKMKREGEWEDWKLLLLSPVITKLLFPSQPWPQGLLPHHSLLSLQGCYFCQMSHWCGKVNLFWQTSSLLLEMDCAPIATEDTGYCDDSFILLFLSFIHSQSTWPFLLQIHMGRLMDCSLSQGVMIWGLHEVMYVKRLK